MSNDHHHHSENMRRVVIALILTGSFMIVEVIGGVISGSLALLADAGHRFVASSPPPSLPVSAACSSADGSE